MAGRPHNKTRNKIKKLIELRMKDIGKFIPSEQFLNNMRMDRSRFKRLLSNQCQPHPSELPLFAEWLECTEEELLEPITDLFEKEKA